MNRIFRAELLKLRTVRGTYGFVAVTALLAAIPVAGSIASASASERERPSWQVDLVSVASLAEIAAILLGVTLVTTEWRHGTVTPSLLATPVRWLWLTAKTATGAVAGFALGVVALVLVAAVAIPWLAALGVTLHVGTDAASQAGRVLAAAAIAGALGVAFGTVVHNQVAGVIGVLLWFLAVETLVIVLLGVAGLDSVGDYLPGRATSALDGSTDNGLAPWAGGLVAVAWVALLLVLGIWRTERRDIV